MSVSLEGDRWLLLNIPNGADLWKPGPHQPDDTVNDAFGADDKLIRLHRAALAACADQALDDEERALLRKWPFWSAVRHSRALPPPRTASARAGER